MATRTTGKKKTKHEPLSQQVEKVFLAGLAKLGVTKQQLAREHKALKEALKKADVAAGRVVEDMGDEMSQLTRSVKKAVDRVKKKAAKKTTAKKKAAKKKPAAKKPAAKKKTAKRKR